MPLPGFDGAVLALGLASLCLWVLALGLRGSVVASKAPPPASASLSVSVPPLAPYRLPILRHSAEVLANVHRVHDWVTDLALAHGGRPFRIQLLNQPPLTLLTRVEDFEAVLKTHFEAFDKGERVNECLRDLLGHGIFAVDGRQWRHQRKTASNLFTMRALRDSMAHTVHELLPAMHRLLERAAISDTHGNGGGSLDLVRLLNRFTMEGFAKIGFGIDLGALEAETEHPFQSAFDSAQRLTTLRFIRPSWFWKTQRWLGVGAEAELKRHIQVIDNTVLGIIAKSLEHRQRTKCAESTATERQSQYPHTAPQDIVSLFLDDISHDAKRPDDAPFDPVFLRDIVVNFLIAGRDTTAQALCWFFLELGRHPHVERRVQDELIRELPRLTKDSTLPMAPSMDEVQRLIYLEAALRETLRLHPSVPANFKEAQRDVVLDDGTFIPEGGIVGIWSYVLGRMPHVWGPDARDFRPERWLDPADPRRLVPVSAFQFTAFHAGPRMCLGMNLAMMEMKILVASVLSRFEIIPVADQDVTYDLSLTLPMRGAFHAHILRRRPGVGQ